MKNTEAINTVNTEEEIFSRTEKEYKEADRLLSLTRKLFDTLKAMEEIGEYGSKAWAETFSKYAETFKKAHGYRPHWAR